MALASQMRAGSKDCRSVDRSSQIAPPTLSLFFLHRLRRSSTFDPDKPPSLLAMSLTPDSHSDKPVHGQFKENASVDAAGPLEANVDRDFERKTL